MVHIFEVVNITTLLVGAMLMVLLAIETQTVQLGLWSIGFAVAALIWTIAIAVREILING